MNWLKFKYLYLSFSILLVVSSIICLLVWGLKPAIDFTGGSLLEIKVPQSVSEDQIRSVFRKYTDNNPNVVTRTDDEKVIIKSQQINNSQSLNIKQELASTSGYQIEIDRFESIGPILGSELLSKTIIALILAATVILIYVAVVFKNYLYGVSAIIAMLHDTVILLGAFSVFGKLWNIEVDSLYVTAVLTTLSFSVHDTVVVYDRIRESLKKFPDADLTSLANKAITETMPRSLNNSMTIIFMLVALILIGGSSVYWMAVALLIGTISGTYSSPFVAVPLLIVLKTQVHKFPTKNKKPHNSIRKNE